jgi:hypothetical protein
LFKFRCKKCKETFTIEQHPLFSNFNKELKENEKKGEISRDEKIKLLAETFKSIAEQVRCVKCESTVYLTGVANVDIDEGIDVTSEPLVQLIKDLIDLHKEFTTEAATSQKAIEYFDEVNEYAREIIEELMWNPGTLVYFEDPELMEEAKKAMDNLWENMDYDELSNEMFSGGYSGLMVNIIGNYIEKMKLVKPTFISVKPNNQIRSYFQQAMHAWTFGLNVASLVLCCSILESLLKQELLKKDPKLVYDPGKGKSLKDLKDRPLNQLITNAFDKKLIDKDEKSSAFMIKDLRDDAVHKLKEVSSEDTYNSIIKTRELIEKLLSE